MEGLLLREWVRTLPGCSGTTTLAREVTIPAMSSSQPAISRWRDGVSKPCGVVSTQEVAFFVPRLLELDMYGGISDREMGLCPPRVRGTSNLTRGATLPTRWL